MNRKKMQTYAAERNGERHVGNIHEIASLIGVMSNAVYAGVRRRKHVKGWTISALTHRPVRYLATKDLGELGYTSINIRGTAVDLAEQTGLTTGNIRALAHTGGRSRSGWRIERLYEGGELDESDTG